MIILVKAQDRNTNARGAAHGGFLSSVVDIALSYATATVSEPS